jgi:CheY-like chemotaxis protein
VAALRRGRDPRLVSRCRAEFERPSGTVEAETEDISARGLFIRTESLLPAGETTEVRVTLPDGTYLALRARVAHMLTPSAARAIGRHAGMGFELVGPETPSRRKLRAYLETLRVEVTNPGLQASAQSAQLLVVEPSDAMRSRLASSLEAAGFHVTSAMSATHALQACASWRPDAVVAAAEMDGMSGVDLAYAMSEHATLSDVPLVLSGEEGDLARLEAFRAGVRDYIPRPFLDEELVIRVHRVAAPALAARAGLRGNLLDIGLGTLLSLLEFERKSGILMLARTNELARVYVADGRLLKLDGGSKDAGLERLMRLLDWRDGQFEFTPGPVAGRDEIGLPSVAGLLLEHARQRDEQSAPIAQRR